MAKKEVVEDEAPLHDLTAFQRDLLAVVASLDEPHGLGVKNEIEAAYGSAVNHGRLYPNLDTLVDMGLMWKGKVDGRTNSYALTRRGQRELGSHVNWLGEKADV